MEGNSITSPFVCLQLVMEGKVLRGGVRGRLQVVEQYTAILFIPCVGVLDRSCKVAVQG
jgi:hypothetical protein